MTVLLSWSMSLAEQAGDVGLVRMAAAGWGCRLPQRLVRAAVG
ncbi:hypothetical protein [Nonomuraea sp. NPDC005650]